MFDEMRLDWAQEYRQHVGGRDFWEALLLCLIGGSLGSSDFLLHVRDLTLTDPEMAYAVASIVGRADPGIPRMALMGLTTKDVPCPNGGKHTRDNVERKLLAHLTLRLAADAIQATTLSELSTAVATISASNATGQLNRVKAAILLVMACPEYLIQK